MMARTQRAGRHKTAFSGSGPAALLRFALVVAEPLPNGTA